VDIGSFPLLTTEDYANLRPSKRLAYRFARHPLTILFGYFTMFLYGMCLKPVLGRPREHADAALALVLHLALIVGLAWYAPAALLWSFLVPLVISSAVGAYLFYAQHNFPGAQIKPRGEWDYVFAALHSSSYVTMPRLFHWLTGNIGYHHVHHLNARIPFYRLPEAMAAVEELQSPTRTSLSPRDIWGCLRLKLWDVKRNCLVPFSGRPPQPVATVTSRAA
jgi:omega-6 fatty acid desaturase (delta-12 desaturase)